MHSKIKNFIWAFLYYFYNNFLTYFPLYIVRKTYLKNILRIKIGTNSSIAMGCFFTGNNIVIGSNCVINRKCYIDGRFGIYIHDNVGISPECYLISLTHDINSIDFRTYGQKIQIFDYCWIAARVIILPGVELKKGCVAGAGSIITKSFDEFSVVAGAPAKIITKRNSNLQYKLNYFPLFDTDICI